MIKDIIIPARVIRREIILLVVSLLIATGINWISIIIYKTQWKELITQFHWVIILSFMFYLLTIVFRLIFLGFRRLLKRPV